MQKIIANIEKNSSEFICAKAGMIRKVSNLKIVEAESCLA